MFNHEWLSIKDAIAQLSVTRDQYTYAVKKPDFPAEAVKPNPDDPRSKMVHVPTLAKFVAPGNSLVLKRMAQQTAALVAAGEVPDGETLESLAAPNLEPDASDLGYIKRRREYWAAIRERQFAQKEAGELVEVEVVRKATADAFLAFQDSLMSVPDQIANVLVEETEAHECGRIVREAITNALRMSERRIRAIV